MFPRVVNELVFPQAVRRTWMTLYTAEVGRYLQVPCRLTYVSAMHPLARYPRIDVKMLGENKGGGVYIEVQSLLSEP